MLTFFLVVPYEYSKAFLKKKRGGRKKERKRKERKKIEEEDDSILYRALQKSLSGGWRRAKRRASLVANVEILHETFDILSISFSPVYFR